MAGGRRRERWTRSSSSPTSIAMPTDGLLVGEQPRGCAEALAVGWGDVLDKFVALVREAIVGVGAEGEVGSGSQAFCDDVVHEVAVCGEDARDDFGNGEASGGVAGH